MVHMLSEQCSDGPSTGPLGKNGRRPIRSSNAVNIDDSLDKRLLYYFNREFGDVGDDQQMIWVNDKKVLAIMEGTVSLKGGHYEMALPFKVSPPCPPNNRKMAESRLKPLMPGFRENVERRTGYRKFIEDLLVCDFAEMVPPEEVNTDGLLLYLPHHPVYHPQKKKLRVVFDCSATYNGVSLNEQLYHGPDMTNTLIGILVGFRQEPIVLVADVESMFHQVRVIPEQRDALRFLWWSTDDFGKRLMNIT
ncbi:uncharacterized protein LOC141907781 [Tubulanus polymorphus]|uniref:uncharacterized protein LOC141907781 n=1 Tax=Tubulanus polymorphus TaxID=672921 RepID=UPI003DA34F0C